MSTTARIEMRVNPDFKEEAERAAALLGMKSLTEFITQAMHEKAQSVIQEHQHFSLSNEMFDQFYKVCQSEVMPSKELKALAEKVDAQDIK